MRETKRAYGWPEDAQFLVPDGVYEHFADGDRRARRQAARRMGAARRRTPSPALAAQIDQMQRRELPDGWDADIPSFDADPRAGSPPARRRTRC